MLEPASQPAKSQSVSHTYEIMLCRHYYIQQAKSAMRHVHGCVNNKQMVQDNILSKFFTICTLEANQQIIESISRHQLPEE